VTNFDSLPGTSRTTQFWEELFQTSNPNLSQRRLHSTLVSGHVVVMLSAFLSYGTYCQSSRRQYPLLQDVVVLEIIKATSRLGQVWPVTEHGFIASGVKRSETPNRMSSASDVVTGEERTLLTSNNQRDLKLEMQSTY
jgi:hypothetical protein